MEVSCKVYSELQFVACYGKNISLSLSETWNILEVVRISVPEKNASLMVVFFYVVA